MASNLWDDVNGIDYNLPYCEVDIMVFNGLEKILGSIDKNNEEYNKVEILRDVFLLTLDFNDSEKPYKNRRFPQGGVEGIIDMDNFTEEMKDTLKTIIDERVLDSTFILYRVLDVYFILRKDYLILENSLFPTLMKLIDETLFENNLSLFVALFKRGFQLFGKPPKKNIENEKTKILIRKVDEVLTKYNMETASEKIDEIYDLIGYLHRYKFVKDKKYPEIATNIARVLEENKDFVSAVEWWELCIKWNNKIKENDLAGECVKNKALCFYEIAKQELEKENYFIVIEKMDSALLNLRKVRGNEELIKQWTQEKSVYQKKSLGQLKGIGIEGIDMTSRIEEMKKQLVGKDYMQMLWFIGGLAQSPNYEKILKGNANEVFMVSSLLQKRKLNEDGKTIHTSKNDEEFPDHLILEYGIHYSRVALEVRNAIETLCDTHFLEVKELLRITSDNPFIPEGREQIVAKGLLEGLKGDYATSLSVLIPQFENSIRFLLEANGEIVTSLGEDTVQEEKNLNQLLLYEKLEEIFGLNAVKDMKYLFVHKGGCNLRNRVSHGLMCEAEFYTDAVVYAFTLMLKIIIFPKLEVISKGQQS
ncbi:DUF4209 domain-containing protein [Bacillus cereus]|nr:DUF4209 domain-containing protein [Bacillus cereus]MEB9557688.1 DUF4209 domain-containing protein [Bacillus cereus]